MEGFIEINTPSGRARLATVEVSPGVMALQYAPFSDGGLANTDNPLAVIVHKSPHSRVTEWVGNSKPILETNPERHTYKIYNSGPVELYIKEGTDCTPISFTKKLAVGEFYESGLSVYTGEITGAWAKKASDSVAHVTELY